MATLWPVEAPVEDVEVMPPVAIVVTFVAVVVVDVAAAAAAAAAPCCCAVVVVDCWRDCCAAWAALERSSVSASCSVGIGLW